MVGSIRFWRRQDWRSGLDESQTYDIAADLTSQAVAADTNFVAVSEPPRRGQENAVAGQGRLARLVLCRLDEKLSAVVAQKSDGTILGEARQREMTGSTPHAQRHVIGCVDTPFVSDLSREDDTHRLSVHRTTSGFGGVPGVTTSCNRTSRYPLRLPTTV